MKIKMAVERIADKELDTVLEWFAITERLFKFVSWLLMLGVLFALYLKTKHVILLISLIVLALFVLKLIAKMLIFRVHITIDGIERHPAVSIFLGRSLSIAANLAVLAAFYWVTMLISQAFVVIDPPWGHH